jgi:hypothetical protein
MRRQMRMFQQISDNFTFLVVKPDSKTVTFALGHAIQSIGGRASFSRAETNRG